MILRALRPQFPDAVFFTNNYDAHFERRDDWEDTHNLVIASPFGSTVPEIYVANRHVPPFRDSNQTSMYVGTLVATKRMNRRRSEVANRGSRASSKSAGAARTILVRPGIAGAQANRKWFSSHATEKLKKQTPGFVIGCLFPA